MPKMAQNSVLNEENKIRFFLQILLMLEQETKTVRAALGNNTAKGKLMPN